ncbi:nucleoporin autopeptidase-domain-containing protein [Lanmaoa asiatica]|nr:nucleoporin autopeptidase-domain-containing protein [Lanmaoa asiatica]
MFGSNTVQSSWANPQQNQQQTQGSAFGQPSAFGSGGKTSHLQPCSFRTIKPPSTAFGSTNAFGQPQQPAANPMFGNLGTSNTGTPTFGTFSQNTAASTGTSAFGAPKPATGFGVFGGGGTSAFGGGGSAFGGTPATGTSGTNVFGPTAPSTGSAFGAGSSLFGQPKPATTFGATPATSTDTNPPPVTTGSSTPAYSVFSEKDPSNPSTILQYQTVTATPAYRGTSLEELRLQDYQQNRKTAGAFGQTSFGAPATQTTSLFGAPTTSQQPATGSIFGGATTGAFGTSTTQPATGAFTAFGQQQPATGTSAGTGVFGGGSAFGQQQQQQQQHPSAFSAFGQPQQQQPAAGTGTSIFGGTSAFGQPKPATGFGSTFGQPRGGNAFSGAGTTSAFGQPVAQPATGTSIFGQPQQQQTSAAFGATTAAKPSIFGQPSQPAGTTTGFGTGLFGGQQQAQPTQTTTSLFGTAPSTGTSLFGQPQPPQQQQTAQQTGVFGTTTTQPSGGLFGGATGSGLFGGTPATQTQQPGQTSLFGAPKPPTTGTGLFGGGTFGQPNTNIGAGAQPTLFGQPSGQQTMAQPITSTGTGAFGGSLFGQQKPVAPAINTAPSTGGLGTSLFGASTLGSSTAAPGGPGTLTASIAEPISSNLPIFSMLPPGPRAVPIDQQQKKKPGFFVDAPARLPVPRLPINYTPASSRLRGFGASASSSVLGVPGQNLSLSNGKAGTLVSSRAEAPESILGRSASPALGSGGRQSVKKLVLDKKIEASDLFSRAGSPGLRGSPAKVTFSPALSQAAREKDVAREKEVVTQSPEKPARPTQPPPRNVSGRFTAHSSLTLGQPSSSSKVANSAETTSISPPLQHGDYWVKPDLAKLKMYGYEELSSFKDLVVGRVGYGEIHFLEPVDLTGLPKLGALLGELVRFDDKECSVYPDGDETDKPAPGTGLNVEARIILLRCWATDKATREPIKDEQVHAAVKHLKRLKSMKETHFESFDAKEGEWTFTVDHF